MKFFISHASKDSESDFAKAREGIGSVKIEDIETINCFC